MTTSIDKDSLLIHWESDLRIACWGHYKAADQLENWNKRIGISSIILSSIATISGSSVWYFFLRNIKEINQDDQWLGLLLQFLTIFAAVLAGILTSIQTFLKFPEKAEQHRSAGVRYASLLRKIEQRRVLSQNDSSNHEEWCENFRNEWEEIARDNQSVPSDLWDQMSKEYMVPLDIGKTTPNASAANKH